jgi:thiosulfate reductase cytochrome b subunit
MKSFIQVLFALIIITGLPMMENLYWPGLSSMMVI